MSEIEILLAFKKVTIDFFDELIEQFPKEGDLILLRIFFKDQAPFVDVINYFILKILPLKGTVIKKRDESFFLTKNDLFQNLSKSNVNKFRQLWRRLDNEDKKIIWKWLDSFVYLAKKYQVCRSASHMF